jgi:hypothetical protein
MTREARARRPVGCSAFLASFKRMHEIGGRWRPVQSVELVEA